jgi:elongation factor P hydroxylase
VTAREKNFTYKEQVKNPAGLEEHLDALRAEAPQNLSEHKQGVMDSVISNFLRGNDQTANSILDKATARTPAGELGRISQEDRKKFVDAILEHREAYAEEIRGAVERPAQTGVVEKSELGRAIEEAISEQPTAVSHPDGMPGSGGGKGDALREEKKRPRITKSDRKPAEQDEPGAVAHVEGKEGATLNQPEMGDALERREKNIANNTARDEQLNYLAQEKFDGNLDKNVDIERASLREVNKRAAKMTEPEQFGLSEEDLAGMSVFEHALSAQEGEDYTFSHEDQKGYLWFNKGTENDRVKISRDALQKILNKEKETKEPMPEAPKSKPEETTTPEPVAAEGAEDVVVDLDADEAGATSPDKVVPVATEVSEPATEIVEPKAAETPATVESSEPKSSPDRDALIEQLRAEVDDYEKKGLSAEEVGKRIEQQLAMLYDALDDKKIAGESEKKEFIEKQMLEMQQIAKEHDEMVYLPANKHNEHARIIYPGATANEGKHVVTAVSESRDEITIKEVGGTDEWTVPIVFLSGEEIDGAPKPKVEAAKETPKTPEAEYNLDMSDLPRLVTYDATMTLDEINAAIEQNNKRMTAIEAKERDYHAFLRGETAEPKKAAVETTAKKKRKKSSAKKKVAPPKPEASAPVAAETTPTPPPPEKEGAAEKPKRRRMMNRGSGFRRKKSERLSDEELIEKAVPMDTLFDDSWGAKKQKEFYTGRALLFMKNQKADDMPSVPMSARELVERREGALRTIEFLNEHWDDKDQDEESLRGLISTIPPINKKYLDKKDFNEYKLNIILTNLEKFHGLPVDEE